MPEVHRCHQSRWDPKSGGRSLSEGNLESQQSVLNLLRQFKGTEPVKQLFWSELNYDRVNKPLSRRGWTDAVAGDWNAEFFPTFWILQQSDVSPVQVRSRSARASCERPKAFRRFLIAFPSCARGSDCTPHHQQLMTIRLETISSTIPVLENACWTDQ